MRACTCPDTMGKNEHDEDCPFLTTVTEDSILKAVDDLALSVKRFRDRVEARYDPTIGPGQERYRQGRLYFQLRGVFEAWHRVEASLGEGD